MIHLINEKDALYTYQFDGKGGLLPLSDTAQASSEQPIWLHLDCTQESSKEWLQNTPLLPDSVRGALSGESSRPRMARLGSGVLLILNTINFNKDERPDQLIVLRIYLTDSLIVSTQCHEAPPITTLLQDMQEGSGPINCGEWLVQLADTLTDHASQFIGDLHDKIIDMEDNILEQQVPERSEMVLLRTQLIVLRRYFSPQRDMFSLLASEERLQWISDADRIQIQAVADCLGRGLADVDASIARTIVITDEINGLMSEAMNRRTYTISILAMIFFPTTLLTGIFGTNLAGTPGTSSSSAMAFPIFCVILLILGIGMMWWLKRSKWL